MLQLVSAVDRLGHHDALFVASLFFLFIFFFVSIFIDAPSFDVPQALSRLCTTCYKVGKVLVCLFLAVALAFELRPSTVVSPCFALLSPASSHLRVSVARGSHLEVQLPHPGLLVSPILLLSRMGMPNRPRTVAFRRRNGHFRLPAPSTLRCRCRSHSL